MNLEILNRWFCIQREKGKRHSGEQYSDICEKLKMIKIEQIKKLIRKHKLPILKIKNIPERVKIKYYVVDNHNLFLITDHKNVYWYQTIIDSDGSPELEQIIDLEIDWYNYFYFLSNIYNDAKIALKEAKSIDDELLSQYQKEQEIKEYNQLKKKYGS